MIKEKESPEVIASGLFLFSTVKRKSKNIEIEGNQTNTFTPAFMKERTCRIEPDYSSERL